MTRSESLRLAALEDELEELRGALWMMLRSDDPLRTARVLLDVQQPHTESEADEQPTDRPRPQLRALDGGRSDRPRPAPGHDRHGLHAV